MTDSVGRQAGPGLCHRHLQGGSGPHSNYDTSRADLPESSGGSGTFSGFSGTSRIVEAAVSHVLTAASLSDRLVTGGELWRHGWAACLAAGYRSVRAENRIHGSGQHSCSPGAPPVMITDHMPSVPVPPDHATSRIAAAVRREDAWKTAEILILRRQLAVLQRRQPRRPKLRGKGNTAIDRAKATPREPCGPGAGGSS